VSSLSRDKEESLFSTPPTSIQRNGGNQDNEKRKEEKENSLFTPFTEMKRLYLSSSGQKNSQVNSTETSLLQQSSPLVPTSSSKLVKRNLHNHTLHHGHGQNHRLVTPPSHNKRNHRISQESSCTGATDGNLLDSNKLQRLLVELDEDIYLKKKELHQLMTSNTPFSPSLSFASSAGNASFDSTSGSVNKSQLLNSVGGRRDISYSFLKQRMINPQEISVHSSQKKTIDRSNRRHLLYPEVSSSSVSLLSVDHTNSVRLDEDTRQDSEVCMHLTLISSCLPLTLTISVVFSLLLVFY
jgi:hypothetical protein